ncbi:MAG: glycerophosphodiester phosphodiesterase [Acholeplasmataceae bacterium]
MKYIAHRGLSAMAPENTLAAFKLVDQKTHYHAIECDIYTTKDHQFVVFHDDTLKRMTGKKGHIMDYTYDELKTLKIISGEGIDQYPHEHIPLLKEYLDVCQTNQKVAQIEIKKVHDMTLLSELVDLLDLYPTVDKEIISFELNYLKYMRALSSVSLKYLTTKLTDAHLYECRVHELHIAINKESVSPALVKKLKKQGFTISVFTVDDYEEALYLEKLGIDELTTNLL